MNEIKETLSILKARWLEAALIIGLVALPAPLINLLSATYTPKNMSWMKFINMGTFLIYISLSLFVLLIGGGFLRTVYLEAKKRQTVSGLIKTGRHFFSRLFRFGILYTGAMMLPLMLLLLISQAKFSDVNLTSTLTFVVRITQPTIKLILVKPILLVPAMIIVLNCEMLESFGLMRRIRLLDAKPMLTIFIVQLFLIVLWMFSQDFSQGSLWQHPVHLLYSIISAGLSLTVMIMAVRFVAAAEKNLLESQVS